MRNQNLYYHRKEKILRELENTRPDQKIIFFQCEDRNIIDYVVENILFDSDTLKNRMHMPEERCAFEELEEHRVVVTVDPENISSTGNAHILYQKDFDSQDERKSLSLIKAFLDMRKSCKDAYLFLSSEIKCVPQPMANQVKVIEVGYPTVDEIAEMLKLDNFANASLNEKNKYELKTEEISKLAHLLRGMSSELLEDFFYQLWNVITDRESFVKNDAEKMIRKMKNVAENSVVLNLVDTSDAQKLGGAAQLKQWINERLMDLVDPEEAKKYGIDPPRGIVLTGVPGTGKSQFARLLAKMWSDRLGYPVNLYELDVSKLNDSLFGQSEKNMARFLYRIGVNEPSILFIDEIEKKFKADDSSGQGMHSAMSAQLGMLLTWMQEHKENVFCFFTANSLKTIPPELLRPGRLSARFFTFLPTAEELLEIMYFRLHSRTENNPMFSNGCRNHIREVCEKISQKRSVWELLGNIEIENIEKEVEGFLNDLVSQNEANGKTGHSARFMTGANMDHLINDVILALRNDRAKDPDKTYEMEDILKKMREQITTPFFISEGQSSMNNIVKIYLEIQEKGFTNVSDHELLPFKLLDPEEGKFVGELPPCDHPYDECLQSAIRERVEECLKEKLHGRLLQKKQEELVNYQLSQYKAAEESKQGGKPNGQVH